MQRTKQPLFDLGQLVATPGALAALEKTGQNAMEFLSRHITGALGEEDQSENQLSLEQGFRANVVLIGNDLSKLVETLTIARHCHRTIMQNFVGTLVVDSMGVGLAAFGFLNPLLAAFIHVSSEMAFIFNSARLLPPVSSANKPARGFLSQSSAVVHE
jgi:hypothetical protein